MLKKIILALFCIVCINTAFAGWDSSPTQILEDLRDKEVQNTALDNITNDSTKWIVSTLDEVRKDSGWYLQWIAYFWLSIALILIIYNWIMLIISWGTGSDEMWKFKKRFVNLVIWVVVLTSWYLIIKFSVSIIQNLFG